MSRGAFHAGMLRTVATAKLPIASCSAYALDLSAKANE